jgi:hypothetical protein
MGLAGLWGIRITEESVEKHVDTLLLVTIGMVLITMGGVVIELMSFSYFTLVLNLCVPAGLVYCVNNGTRLRNRQMLNCYCFWSGCSFFCAIIYAAIYISSWLEWGAHSDMISSHRGTQTYVCLPTYAGTQIQNVSNLIFT